MASTDNCSRHRATMIIGRRTWLLTGTSLVVIGTVAIAAGLVFQQQLHRSKRHVSLDCNFQSTNAKIGIWFGIAIVLYGLLTISAGICRTKALMTMLALLSVLFISFNLTHLLISEVSIMPSGSSHNNSSEGRWNETNGGGGEPQTIATEDGDDRLSLRFSPEDRIIALEKMLRRGDQGTKLGGKSSAMNNNNNDHSMKYQHQTGAHGDYGRDEDTEERGHGIDQDLLDRKFKGGKAVRFEEKPLSSADVSSIVVTGNKVTTTLASELKETEDESAYESSGSGKGSDNDDDDYENEDEDKDEDENEDGFETAGKEPGIRDEYDSYDSELKDVEGNKTAAEEKDPLSTFSDWYENEISWIRRKRELGGEEDCLEEEENNLQWLIQLMNCLMAVIRFIVLVLSIVLATLILAPCCCYQKDEMESNAKKFNGIQQSVTPVAAADKDDTSQWQNDDATLLQV